MSAKVFACISHKGGTGRTTTSANVAYRLALQNRSVCCIDLDLDSPTFGAVAGLRGVEQGAKIGIHDFLHVDDGQYTRRAPDLAPDVLIDIWQKTKLPRPSAGRAGRLRLLPGGKDRLGLRLVPVERQGKILAQILAKLRDDYDYLLLDVRSGASDTVAAVLAADDEIRAIRWLVFFRWTSQHLAGAADLCERLAQSDADLALVRTAFTDAAGMESWFRQQHKTLMTRARDTLPGWEVFTDIPVEPMLQWKEGIITEDHVRDGIASREIVESYESLTARLEAI